jgi:hypothetical protein
VNSDFYYYNKEVEQLKLKVQNLIVVERWQLYGEELKPLSKELLLAKKGAQEYLSRSIL